MPPPTPTPERKTHAPPAVAGVAPSPDDLRDLQLVKAIRANEPRAWQELLTRYQDRLYGVCLRMVGTSPRARELATDLCQDAMVKIIQGLGTYDGTSRLSTWMIRVTMNVCLSYLRGQKLRRHASLDAPHPPSGASKSGSDKGLTLAEVLESRELGTAQRVSQEQARVRLSEALARLDPEQRAILVLRDVRNLDYGQIGECLGVPVGTVKSRLFRARAALRNEFEKNTGK